jgi:hypothetical protein
VHVRKRNIGADRPQTHGAIHSSGIDVKIAEFVRDTARESAFAGAGRSVDRDSDPLAQIL